MRHMTLM